MWACTQHAFFLCSVRLLAVLDIHPHPLHRTLAHPYRAPSQLAPRRRIHRPWPHFGLGHCKAVSCSLSVPSQRGTQPEPSPQLFGRRASVSQGKPRSQYTELLRPFQYAILPALPKPLLQQYQVLQRRHQYQDRPPFLFARTKRNASKIVWPPWRAELPALAYRRPLEVVKQPSSPISSTAFLLDPAAVIACLSSSTRSSLPCRQPTQ